MNENDILLKAIIDGGKHSILVTHRSGVVKFMNQAAERLYGYPADHFVGRDISNFRLEVYDRAQLEAEAEAMSREFGQAVRPEEVFMRVLESRGSYEKEWTAVRRDGARIDVLVSVTAMRDEKGDIVGFLSISQDISERKALERMKAEFIAAVSHELRTPLTSIRGALGLMAGGAVGALPAAANELVALAHRNSERLARIINDLLDIEKLESGKFVFQTRPFGAAQVLRQCIEEHGAFGVKHGVRFVLKGDAGALRVLADPDRTAQVLANLLSNAAKYSRPAPEVWVWAEAEGDFVRFSVRDFGPGIPEEFRESLFQKFAQGAVSGGLRYESSGLGLSIAREMVQAMGGDIRFETETGKGTTFSFTLPLAPAAPEAAPEAADDTGDAGRRVLICEDDHDVGTLLKLLLERAGITVDLVGTIAEARRALEAREYAAMTLDLQLPDGDGLGLLRELRTSTRWSKLPVVVVSVKAEEGRRELDTASVELVDWVVKPIDEHALTRSLDWALAVKGSARPRILHVEDDGDLRRVLADFLKDKAEWVGVSSLREARERIRHEDFDLVVLDLALPDGSGLALLEGLNTRAGAPIPVLILSSDPSLEELRERVAAVLQKSRVSEERVVQTVLSLLKGSAKDEEPGKTPKKG